MLASIVTDGKTSDTIMFERLWAKIPEGSGPAMGDYTYCSSANCEAARGGDPYFELKKN